MAGIKISDMTALTALVGSEQIPIVQSGANKSITPFQLMGNVYNVKLYGATGNGTTNDTTAIQAAITAATTNGGVIYIPSGTYLVNTLTLTNKVRIKGEGYTSILKSATTEPLINILNDAEAERLNWEIDSIVLNGDNTGTIGLNMTLNCLFKFNHVIIHQFTQYGIYARGLLMGVFRDCWVHHNGTGILNNIDDGGILAPNLVTFINCTIQYNSLWGINWSYGWLINFISCDFENNGTNGNAATGAISYTSEQAVSSNYGQGIILNGCWFEYNYGTVVKIVNTNNTGGLISSVNNCIFIVNIEVVSINVVSDTGANKVIIRDSSLMDGASLKLDGAAAVVVNDQSNIVGSITQNDSSKYYTVDVTEVT